jgi:hypothetical protein
MAEQDFGDPGPVTRSRTGRTAAVAVGIAVALGAGGYGIAVAAGGPGAAPNGGTVAAGASPSASGGGPAATCAGAFQRGAVGTLKSDNGSTLTVQSPDSTTHTVTTTSSTVVTRVSSGKLTDIANGDKVLVSGSFANNTLTAKSIVSGSGLDLGTGAAPDGAARLSGRGFASGTVADTTSSGFTVVTTDGGRVTVAASSSASVDTVTTISVGALHIGQRVTVAGTPDSSGKISATRVEELDTTATAPSLGFGPGFGFGFGPGAGSGGRGPGAFGAVPHSRPSNAPTNLPANPPNWVKPSNAPGGGFGMRGHGKGPQTCGTTTPAPSASASTASPNA